MTNAESGSGPETSRDHSALRRSYGEALIQISELEDEVAKLRQLAGGQTSESAGAGPIEGRDGPTSEALEPRLRDLERGITGGAQGTPDPVAPSGEARGMGYQADYQYDSGQLRLQVTSLANQLPQVLRELEEAQNKPDRVPRRSRSSGDGHHRRWWRLWRKDR